MKAIALWNANVTQALHMLHHDSLQALRQEVRMLTQDPSCLDVKIGTENTGVRTIAKLH